MSRIPIADSNAKDAMKHSSTKHSSICIISATMDHCQNPMPVISVEKGSQINARLRFAFQTFLFLNFKYWKVLRTQFLSFTLAHAGTSTHSYWRETIRLWALWFVFQKSKLYKRSHKRCTRFVSKFFSHYWPIIEILWNYFVRSNHTHTQVFPEQFKADKTRVKIHLTDP